MPLDPQAQDLLQAMASMESPALETLTPPEARAMYAAMAQMRGTDDPIGSIEDRTVPGPAGDVPVRVYRPDAGGTLPVVVFFHGGGWVLGDLDSHDALCLSLASRSGCIVVAVDYRLAPEAHFPEPLDDCLAVVRWVAIYGDEIGADASRMAVAGDSAGGNLAAAVCLVTRDQSGPPVAFQLLIYPVLDQSYETPSCAENAEGYFLTTAGMHWFSGHYLADPADKANPLASPLLADDLTNLAPAHIITAEYDPLRDEGEAYAAALAKAGVAVTEHRYDGMVHGFVSMSALLDQGAAAVDECAKVLHEALLP